tara:strand:- start:40 stop:780 length:741 start_codon:yes stop_codon:yes gene_type:complete
MFSLFTSHSFAVTKHKIYEKLPCEFNGAKVGPSARPTHNPEIERDRCCKGCTAYKGKRGTSIDVEKGTPIIAITDMTLYHARNWSSKYRCIIQTSAQKKVKGNQVKVFNPYTGKKMKCATPFDNIALRFKDDKTGVDILYYHMMSTPLVPGFSKGNCAERKFQREIIWGEGISLPENCGGIIKKNVKKGEVIGKVGHASVDHVSLGIDFRVAPEDYFKWENLPTDSNAYLFPIMSEKYLKEIGYID